MLMSTRYSFTSKVIVYPGHGGWRFTVVPKETSARIKKKYGAQSRGWGSLPVAVTIGDTTWNTSIFPDKRSGTYLLPLKAVIRSKERIADESRVQIAITLRV